MKKFIIALVAMVFTLGAFAQDHQGQGPRREFNPEKMAENRANRMKETLSLTDDQYTKVKEYFLAQAKEQKEKMDKMKEAMQNGDSQSAPKMDRESMEAERKARREAEAKALKEILTAEQYTKYEEQEKNRRERGGNRGQGGPQGGPQGEQNK